MPNALYQHEKYKPMTAEEIAKEIFYSPASNGKYVDSISNGAKLIEEHANELAKEAYDAGIKEGYACADIPRGKTYTETTFEQWLSSRKTK